MRVLNSAISYTSSSLKWQYYHELLKDKMAALKDIKRLQRDRLTSEFRQTLLDMVETRVRRLGKEKFAWDFVITDIEVIDSDGYYSDY
jgi:hypothetical protein